jgi:hypothetical protein
MLLAGNTATVSSGIQHIAIYSYLYHNYKALVFTAMSSVGNEVTCCILPWAQSVTKSPVVFALSSHGGHGEHIQSSGNVLVARLESPSNYLTVQLLPTLYKHTNEIFCNLDPLYCIWSNLLFRIDSMWNGLTNIISLIYIRRKFPISFCKQVKTFHNILLYNPAVHYLVSNIAGSTVSCATHLSIKLTKSYLLTSFTYHTAFNFLKAFHYMLPPIWSSSGV